MGLLVRSETCGAALNVPSTPQTSDLTCKEWRGEKGEGEVGEPKNTLQYKNNFACLFLDADSETCCLGVESEVRNDYF